MPAIVNVADFVKIGVIAVIFIWAANKALGAFGLDTLKA